MPIVTGVLADFTRQAFLNLQPQILFRPSGPAVKSAGNVLYAPRVVVVEPTSSAWQVDLEQTDALDPATWYEVSIRWLDEAGNFTNEEWLPGRLYVPPTGGEFTDLYRVRANPQKVWVSDGGVIPDEARPGDLLLDPTTAIVYAITTD